MLVGVGMKGYEYGPLKSETDLVILPREGLAEGFGGLRELLLTVQQLPLCEGRVRCHLPRVTRVSCKGG
jgi:hypothetical protein